MTGSARPQMASPTVSDRRAQLAVRAQLLAGASVAYNLIEAVLAITWGKAADSAALVGFGLDSTVEVASGLVILWQFRHQVPDRANTPPAASSRCRSSPWPRTSRSTP